MRRSGAARPLVIGDRLDTDIDAAVAAGLDSLLVLTGVNTWRDVVDLPVASLPTRVAPDLRVLGGHEDEFSQALDALLSTLRAGDDPTAAIRRVLQVEDRLQQSAQA